MNIVLLKDKGWNIRVIHEYQLKKEKRDETLDSIIDNLNNQLLC